MLRLTDGIPCWEFDAGGSFVGSPAVVANHLLLANEDGTIWCFRSAAEHGDETE
jgi:outer membrane protein assembly factor BamB